MRQFVSFVYKKYTEDRSLSYEVRFNRNEFGLLVSLKESYQFMLSNTKLLLVIVFELLLGYLTLGKHSSTRKSNSGHFENTYHRMEREKAKISTFETKNG